MKKNKLVCSALATAMMLSSAAPGASAARFADSNGHWSEAAIDRWSDAGVIVGTDGSINPNSSITRGEMATILAEMLGLEERADNTYPDLNGGWYTDAMLKCAAAGIMTGDDHGRMRPYDNITGAEIAVILNKALDLSSSNANYPASATGYVKPWAQSYVNNLASRGIAVGNDGGTFQPMQDTSRAAVISMLDRAVNTYISSPGTYTATGLTLINTNGTVTLKGSPSSIDITASSSGAKITLDHTNVSGTIKVNAPRAQLTASHATLSGDVQVYGYSSSVSLEGTSSAGVIQLSSGAGSSTVTVGSSSKTGSIITDAASTTVNVSGEVNNVQLSGGASSSGVNVRSGASIENVTSNANNVTVSGTGRLRRADIYGSNNRVTTPNTTVSRSVNNEPSTHKNTTTTTTSSRRRSSVSSDRFSVDFYYNDSTNNKFASRRVYGGDYVADPGVPTYANHIFDGWYYYRYYYGYDRDYYYYDWDYRDYWDRWNCADYWDYWYRTGDWKWDSKEEAYYNDEARVYYDDSRDYFFIIVRNTRQTLTTSEVRDRFGKYCYYGSDYWYKDSNWTWSSRWDAYYNSTADLYYDDDDGYYFTVSNGNRYRLSSSDVRDRYGRYYYAGRYLWYNSSDWRWDSSWDAYYNSTANMYYDEDDDYYFIVSSGRRVRLSSSEVRDRYDRYYGSRYYDRYYYGYDYRKGDTFSFNDRIYGDVDLYAKWRDCTDASTESQLTTLLSDGVTKVIQVTNNVTVNGDLTIPSDVELYIKDGVTVTVMGTYTNNGKVTGRGQVSAASAAEIAITKANNEFRTKVSAITAGGHIKSAAWSGNTFTISFTDNCEIDAAAAELQSIANTIYAAIPQGATLTVGSRTCTSANDILIEMGASRVLPAAAALAEGEASATSIGNLLNKSVSMVLTVSSRATTYTLALDVPANVAQTPEQAVNSAFIQGLTFDGSSITATAAELRNALKNAVAANTGNVAITANGQAVTAEVIDSLALTGTVSVKIADTAYTITVTPETPAESSTESPVESSTETPVESSTESPVESSTETPVESSAESPIESSTETPTESSTTTPAESSTKTPVESSTETPVESSKETPVESSTETPVESSKETPVESSTETPVESSKETPVESSTETPVESSTDTPTESSTTTPVESSAETPTESSTVTPAESSAETGEESPALADDITPTEESSTPEDVVTNDEPSTPEDAASSAEPAFIEADPFTDADPFTQEPSQENNALPTEEIDFTSDPVVPVEDDDSQTPVEPVSDPDRTPEIFTPSYQNDFNFPTDTFHDTTGGSADTDTDSTNPMTDSSPNVRAQSQFESILSLSGGDFGTATSAQLDRAITAAQAEGASVSYSVNGNVATVTIGGHTYEIILLDTGTEDSPSGF